MEHEIRRAAAPEVNFCSVGQCLVVKGQVRDFETRQVLELELPNVLSFFDGLQLTVRSQLVNVEIVVRFQVDVQRMGTFAFAARLKIS